MKIPLALTLALTGLLAVACNDEVGQIVSPDAEELNSLNDEVLSRDWERQAVSNALALLEPNTLVRISKLDRTISGPYPIPGPPSYHDALDETVRKLADWGFDATVAADDGDDPECQLNFPTTQEEYDAWEDCLEGLMDDDECEVVVVETYKKKGEMHAHCEEEDPH